MATGIETKIIKWPQPTLDEATHTYTLGRRVIPGFSQIAKAMGLINFDGVPKDKLINKMHIGSAVHLATEFLDKGILVSDSVNPSVLPYLEAYKQFKHDYGYEPKLIESPMMNKDYDYACKVDRVGMGGGGLTLVEIKTSPIKPWHIVQVIAQRLCLRPTVRMIILELKKDGTYTSRFVESVNRIGSKVYPLNRLNNGWLNAANTYHFGKEIS